MTDKNYKEYMLRLLKKEVDKYNFSNKYNELIKRVIENNIMYFIENSYRIRPIISQMYNIIVKLNSENELKKNNIEDIIFDHLNNKIFIDQQHQEHFKKIMDKTRRCDLEGICLFYILSFLKRDKPVERLYDFKEEGILSDKTEDMMLSDSQRSLVRLAFHLFTGRDHYNATIVNTFNHLAGNYKEVAYNAVGLYIRKYNI